MLMDAMVATDTMFVQSCDVDVDVDADNGGGYMQGDRKSVV